MIGDNVVAAVKSLGIDNLLIAPCDNCGEAAPEADTSAVAALLALELDLLEME
jgi:hypothetical protein